MLDDPSILLDPAALTLVLGGSLLATVARCGLMDMAAAARALVELTRPDFDIETNRSALAQTLLAIEQDGPLRARASMPPDRTLSDVIDTFFRHRSIMALDEVYRSRREEATIRREATVSAFESAGELAPVFGLVGTLLAIIQLTPGDAGALESTMSSIAGAAVSTLYGVLVGHMLFIPLARTIERRGRRAEHERANLIQWFKSQLRDRPAIAPDRLQREEWRGEKLRGAA